MSDSESTSSSVTGRQTGNTEKNTIPSTPKNSLEEVLLKELLQKNGQLQQARKILIKLRHHLAVYRQVMACHTEALVLINRKQEIIYANPCFCMMTEYGLHRLLEKKLGQLIEFVENSSDPVVMLDKIMQQGRQHAVIKLKSLDQNPVPMRMTITETDIREKRSTALSASFQPMMHRLFRLTPKRPRAIPMTR